MSISRKSALLTGLQSPISPLSLGVQNSELGLRALRYHRVVIMAGAHVDGARIHLLPLDIRFRFAHFQSFISISGELARTFWQTPLLPLRFRPLYFVYFQIFSPPFFSSCPSGISTVLLQRGFCFCDPTVLKSKLFQRTGIGSKLKLPKGKKAPTRGGRRGS